MSSLSDVRPFKVDIPKDEVDRLFRKAKDTRLPKREIVPEAGTDYGPSLQWATDLHRMWTTEFDWYAAQEQINQWPHFVAAVEDLDVHFVHARAKSDKAIPILLVHGWPGSIHEFSRVITPLSQPSSASDPAFHVVVPSLPGFAWSSWPPKAGWTLQDTARILDKLMKKLGHETYVVQCGDWGHFIGRELGTKYTDSCRAVHFNFAPSPLPEGIELTERERKVQERVDDWLQNHIGYAVCMRTRPQTIGIALNDNPVG